MKKFLMGAAMLFSLAATASDGDKTVALTTVYVNKVIQTKDASSILLSKITALSENPAFKLDTILFQFKKKFETEYALNFPFKLLPEQEIITNEKYKEFKSAAALDPNSALGKLTAPLLPEGYKYMTRCSGGFVKDENQDEVKMLQIFPNVDGVIFISLDYTIVPKFAVGGMGSAGVQATARIYLVNKQGERVFDKLIWAMSKKTVGLIAGVPVMDVEDILPVCQSATSELFKEMDEKLPKLLKKIDKRF
jgi:hypothetical protein